MSNLAAEGTLGSPEQYFLRPGYESRDKTAYFADADDGKIWQPDVYAEAAEIARRLGATKLIDFGCGEARKLVAQHPRFEIIGVDFGPNLEACAERFKFGRWIRHDFDSENALNLTEEDLRDSVLISSDVIEHLLRPERLLKTLRTALTHARALVMSTPERNHTRGWDSKGPPENPCHVREWTRGEFEALLTHHGFEHSHVGLTRSHDQDDLLRSILSASYPSRHLLRLAHQRTA